MAPTPSLKIFCAMKINEIIKRTKHNRYIRNSFKRTKFTYIFIVWQYGVAENS
jgi:hypothetical protein